MSLQCETELLIAALRYIVFHRTQENYDVLQDMGLSVDEIELVPSLTLDDIQLLTRSHTARKHIIDLRFKPNGLASMIEYAHREQENSAYKLKLLLHGAPRPMLYALFQTDSNEYAALRRQYQLTGGNGRPSYQEHDEKKLWRVYRQLGKPRTQYTPRDYFLLYQQSQVDLRTIWRLFENWQSEGLLT